MKDIKITDLQDKFVERNVPPYGRVLMIPGKDFDPDWEAALEDMGFGCVFTEINSEKFTLVKLEKEEGEEESTAESRPGAGKFLTNWSHADQERLLKRMEESPGTIKEKVAQLVSEFPGRTATGLQKKYRKLTRGRRRIGRPKKEVPSEMSESPPKGDLDDQQKYLLKFDPVGAKHGRAILEQQRLQQQRLRDANKEQVLRDASIERKLDGAQPDVVKTLVKLESDVATLSDSFEKYRNILVRLHTAVVFQSLELLERDGVLSIPKALRKYYAEALIQPNNKYADAFLDKANALLEASK